MDNNIRKIVELEIDLDNIELDDMGVQCVSFVEEPAIEVDFMAFAKHNFVVPTGGESEDDFIGRCIPVLVGEGYDADKAAAICYSYYEASADTGALAPYVDQLDDNIRVKENFETLSTEEEEIFLEWAAQYGELITENYTYINPNQEFSSVTDIAKAITGLDILGKMGIKQDEPAEIKYRYTGPSAERGFCKAMLGLNRLYSDGDFRNLRGRLSAINPGMGKDGQNSYSVFDYKGGVSCRHWWSKVALYKPEGSRQVLMIEQGPAEGDAGKSNNDDSPSPTGSVRNNASLQYNFAIQNEEKRIVAGPLMIPNQFIPRIDENGDLFYVFFSKDTIKRIQERFNKSGFQNITDIDHNGKLISDNILLEQWIIESREYDKSKFYGFNNLNIGSWFGVYKVNNDETWAKIKDGTIRGFSIAGDFIDKAKAVKNDDEQLLGKIIDVLRDIRN